MAVIDADPLSGPGHHYGADTFQTYLDDLLVRVRDVVAARARFRRSSGGFPGVCPGLDEINELLDVPRGGTVAPVALPADGRIARLRTTMGVTELDLRILVAAIAPEVDGRFERVYGFLHDDVSRGRVSVGLAMDLAGVSPLDASMRAAFLSGSALVDGGLIEIERAERPLLSRAIAVPDRVVMYMLGDDVPVTGVSSALVDVPPVAGPQVDAVAAAVSRGAHLVYLREPFSGGAGRASAAAAFARAGVPCLVVDLHRLARSTTTASEVLREARLAGAALVVGPVEALVSAGDAGPARVFTEGSWPTILIGTMRWDQTWSEKVPLVVEHDQQAEAHIALWSALVGSDLASDVDLAETIGSYRIGPEGVVRAAADATLRAATADRTVTAADLRAGVLAQNGGGLESLARRITAVARRSDLVVRDDTAEQLDEVLQRIRYQSLVLDQWRFRRGGRRGEGVTVLFAGPSGTGKTMAAEVLANELGLDLYTVDLATVVDKYVGETEKNLDRIFSEAEGVNCVLFFDEADALFGKRSEVRDAHDRYANVEVAYLLQRMETFAGVAILATNLRSNMDDAFARRLDGIVEFPAPDAVLRRRLWAQSLNNAPVADDVDLDFCATFELTGGNIRNIVVGAAYLAAAQNAPIGMRQLVVATQRENRKLGRLCVPSEFGRYEHLLQ